MKLTIEIIPSPLWNKNLNKTLPRETWKKIKEDLFNKEGRKCWICNSETTPLHAHEFWNYNDKKHIQKLVAIHHLCLKCHMIKHILFSTATEDGKQVLKDNNTSEEDLIKHFCKINNCTEEDYMKHFEEQRELYHKRSSYKKWKQDLGCYSQ